MDIKQREHKKNIKVLDKAGLLGEKMKNSYIRSRDFVRKQTEKDEEKPEDKLQNASSDIANKSVNIAHEAGKRLLIRSKQKFIKQRLQKNKERLYKNTEKPSNNIKTRENSGQITIKTRDYNAPKIKDNIHKTKTIKHNIKTKETIKNTQNATEQGRKLAERQYIRRTQMRYRLRNKTIVSRNIANSTSKTANAVNESAKQLATKPQFTKPPLQKSLSNHIFNGKRAIKTRKNSDIKIKKAQNRLKIKKKATKTVKATGKTIKTSEQTAKVAVKTTGQTAKAVGKSSVTAIKTAKHTAFMIKQLAIKAAKATAAAAKAVVKATIAAAKATAASIKALIAAIVAGGWVAVLIILVVVVLGGALAMIGNTENSSYTPVSEEVNAYEPLIRIYAQKHGIPDYVELIKAVMMQESGGQGNDPMQASECGFNTKYPNTPNGITDPEYSIDVGIQNLAACLEQAKVESPIDMENIKLALQGYNFGNGYISWAVKNYGGYSYANAVEFSEMMAKKLGWSNYGDKEYVPHVLRYYPYGNGFGGIGNRFIVEIALSQVGNIGGQPYWSWYGFSSRVEWCACFVSWCANECGYLDAGIIPRFSACTTGEAWFKERGQWQSSSYEPKSGDIIFFDWQGDGKTDHVGIVDRVENGIIYTVEGNSSDACKQRYYPIGDEDIYGFGLPSY